MLTTQEQKFVSIFIKPTIDLTLTLEPAEKGVCCAIGKLHMGNPYYPVILGNNPEPLLSVVSNRGGDPANELAYHIQDFFSGYAGKMIIGRVMNTDDTTKVIKQTKDDDGNIILDDSTDINVFGDNNIKDWDDTDPDASVELVVTACPTNKVTIEMINKDDILTVTLYDRYGNEVYSKTGSCYYDAVDDYGKSYYIGNIIDKKIMNVKTDPNNEDYESNFTLVQTYDNGLVVEDGDKNYPQALKIVKNMAEKCDYAISAGITDTQTLQDFRNQVTYPAKLPLIIDLKGNTIDDVVDAKNNLNLNVSDCYFIWNRGKDIFEVGSQNVGLSGFVAGMCVRRNLSRMIDDVEYRVEGIAGVDYVVPRQKEEELEILSDDDLTTLVDNRINTVRDFDGKLVIADILSGEPKNVATRLFPVVEGNLFINRYIARILQAKLFKNLNEAKQFAQVETKKLFDKCQRNGYFDNDTDEKYKIEVTDKDSDTVIVNYWYVPAGVMRRGIVQGTLTQKITN